MEGEEKVEKSKTPSRAGWVPRPESLWIQPGHRFFQTLSGISCSGPGRSGGPWPTARVACADGQPPPARALGEGWDEPGSPPRGLHPGARLGFSWCWACMTAALRPGRLQAHQHCPELENPSAMTIGAGSCDTQGTQGVGFILRVWLGRAGPCRVERDGMVRRERDGRIQKGGTL